MKAKQFNLVLGIGKGYNNLPIEEDLQKEYWNIRLKIQDILLKLYEETNVYVSCNTNLSSTIYNQQWGSPLSGEGTVTISGICNPTYGVAEYKWKSAVMVFANRLKEEYKQSTVTIVFTDCDIEYIA